MRVKLESNDRCTAEVIRKRRDQFGRIKDVIEPCSNPACKVCGLCQDHCLEHGGLLPRFNHLTARPGPLRA
jgi:hypothetical protein